MLGASSISALRAGCDPFDLPANATNNNAFNGNNTYNNANGVTNGNFPFKPLAMSFNPTPTPIRPHLTIAEQAELEFELRYRGNMIVDQQRKIQQLEEELKRTRDQVDMMNTQLTTYEQERLKERKKPQSRYWTPDEHQRFLEALAKYGHKDVKAISMHVSTRNATQVRTHAQKYFLRLERERRKKGDDEASKDGGHDGYNSSGDEMYASDQSLSPVEELSPPTQHISSPNPAQMQTQPMQIPLGTITRRRRSTSLISPAMGKFAPQHQSAVLAELPSWTPEDYEQFTKGLLLIMDTKQEDIGQTCRIIRDGYLPTHTVEDVESCYKTLHKILKQKPAALIAVPVGSPKRRRTSKPELPINMPLINEAGPLPALGSMPPISGNNNGSNFPSFPGGMQMSGSPLPPPQYMNNGINNNSSNNSPVTLLPFQPPQIGGLMNMNINNVNMNMNMRPLIDYSGMPPMQSLQISNMGMGMNNLTMMDIGSPNLPPANSSSSSHPWSSLALSFDLHQNVPPSLSLPQGAPLVSSLN